MVDAKLGAEIAFQELQKVSPGGSLSGGTAALQSLLAPLQKAGAAPPVEHPRPRELWAG